MKNFYTIFEKCKDLPPPLAPLHLRFFKIFFLSYVEFDSKTIGSGLETIGAKMAAVFTKNNVFWIFASERRVGPGRDPKIRDLRKDVHRIGF